MLLVGLVSDLSSQAESGSIALSSTDLEIVDQALQVRRMSPDGGEMFPPLETNVARIYTSGKVRLDRVPALLDAGLQNIEKMTKYGFSMKLFPEEMRSHSNDWRAITEERTEEIRVDYLLASNRPADARPLIEQALARFDGAGTIPSERTYRRSGWIHRLEKVDPIAASQYASPVIAKAVPVAPEFRQTLGEFSAVDLAGRTWRLADLKGKATFVNFWATWCGPCRGEHAGIQELYDRVKDRTDVQVLTFSVDDDADAARKYIKEKGYTFPVICAKDVADLLFPFVGLPTSFLVNPQGVRTSIRGFSPDSKSVGRLID
jgi:thiol-disulfide isomerase/thioredoxin